MIASIVVSIARLATEIPQYANQAQQYVTAATNPAGALRRRARAAAEPCGPTELGKIAQFVGSLLEGISGIAISIVFLLALLLFLSVETTGIAWRLAAGGGDRPQVSAALSPFAVATRTYLMVTTVFGLIVAVLDTVALWIIGVPLVITWGLLSFTPITFQHRVHPRMDPTRTARTRQRRLENRAGRDRRLLRAEPHRAVDH